MKKCVSYIIVCICGMFNVLPSNAQDALYIFRNDSQLLNAFFYSEIDSITYSVYDEWGREYDEYMTQVVYTPDSVYWIPLAAIDSVAFVQPETIYQPNTYELDTKYMPYVKSVDSLTITFALSLPSNLKPSVKDVLYNFAYLAPFDRGFLGRVESVKTNADGIVVNCNLADITEVYKQYASCQNHVQDKERTKAVVSDDATTISKNFNIGYFREIDESGKISFNGNLNYKANIRTVVLVMDGQKQICVQSTENFTLALGYGLELEGSKEEVLDIGKPWLFPSGPLEFSFQPQVYFDINATIALNAETSYTWQVYHEYGNINGEEYDGKQTWSSDGKININKDLVFDGSLSTGVIEQLVIGFPMRSFGVGIELKAGPLITGEIPLKTTSESHINTTFYELAKDANLSFSMIAEITPCAILLGEKIWNPNNIKFEVSRHLWTRYLFPEFSDLSITDTKARMANIGSTVSRNVIFPQKIGFALYNDNDLLENIVYSPTNFQFEKEFNNPMDLTFEQLKNNTKYTVYPIIDLWGNTIRAYPSKTFKLEVNVITGNVTDITADAAVCYGQIDPMDSYPDISYGICYGTTSDLSVGKSNHEMATADVSGNFRVFLNKLDESTDYYYCAYMQLGEIFYYGEIKQFQTLKNDIEDDPPGGNDSDITPGEAIDLGLSVKWAGCNIGATKPEEYGGLYGWGDPTGEHTEWAGDYEPFSEEMKTVYGYYGGYGDNISNITGTSLDIAKAKWGDEWRIPTIEEYKELVSKCTSVWTIYKNVEGRMFIGPNGNKIFFPSTAIRRGTKIERPHGSGGCRYWSGTYNQQWGDPCVIALFSGNIRTDGTLNPCYGLAIRPVCK